jgi:hypothetical protein
MPFLTASLNSKTLHRVAGWKFFASGYDEMPDELDHPDLLDFPTPRSVRIYSSQCTKAHLIGLPDDYPKYDWIFGEVCWETGFCQIYVQPHSKTSDMHIYIGPKLEIEWEIELDRVLSSSHLEIVLPINKFLGDSERHNDRLGGSLFTFRGIPELTISRSGPNE